MTATHSFRDADLVGKSILAPFWVIAGVVFVAKAGKKMAGKIAGAVYIGLAARWKILAETSGRSYETIAEQHIEAFTTTVTEALLEVPPVLALTIAAMGMVALLAWQLDQVWDGLREFWYSTGWIGKAVGLAGIVLWIHLQQSGLINNRPSINGVPME